MKIFLRRGALAAALALSLPPGAVLAQNSPFTGTIQLGLTLSTSAPTLNANFTADLVVNTTGVTGT